MAAVTDALGELDEDPQWAVEAAAAEVRAALRLTRRAADSELELALDLRRRLPAVWDALAAGSIDVRRARVIVSGTSHLSAAVAGSVVEQIIADAGLLTTGQLAARLRRLAIEVDPDEATRLYDRSVADRRVVAQPNPDGSTDLFALNLPPQRVARALKRVNRLARSLRGGSELRTMDQLRTDVLLDLLEGDAHGGRGGVVDIHVDLQTLTHLMDAPGDLAGYGPVVADIARQVAADQPRAEWRYTVDGTQSGQPTHTGTTRRRPTADQQRIVETRDRTCVFPGCRMPAVACDLDHTIPWSESGPTESTNLAPACRHDHSTRHRIGWTYRPLPDGDYIWTSRLGLTYTTSGKPP
jgi:hypothetical protein